MMTRRHTASTYEAAIGFSRDALLNNIALSTRTIRVLQNQGLVTIGDVADAFAYLRLCPKLLPGFGKRTLSEISEVLKRSGMIDQVPMISESAAAVISETGIKRQDIVRYFGAEGQYGPTRTNLYRLKHVDGSVMEELRSIAKFYEELV